MSRHVMVLAGLQKMQVLQQEVVETQVLQKIQTV
jgi:hypothetical protein